MDKVVALAFMPPNEISKKLEMQSYLTFINNLKFLLWGVVAPNQDRSGPFLTGRIQILNQICATGSGSGSFHDTYNKKQCCGTVQKYHISTTMVHTHGTGTGTYFRTAYSLNAK